MIEVINQSKKRLIKKNISDLTLNIKKRILKHSHFFNQDQIDRIKKFALNIVIVDKSQMKKLNSKFRNKNYATDVLSFDGLMPKELGELVICYEVIVKQAKENKWTIDDEMSYMILHGVLHLLGFDHEKNEREAKKMFSIQDAIFFA